MNPTEDTKETVRIKDLCVAKEDENHHVQNAQVKARHPHTLKYVEKKLVDKAVQRLERHPADGLPLKHDPKKGHSGKYIWEGPEKAEEVGIGVEDELMDEEQVEDGGEEVGEVEVAKVGKEGVARIEVDPRLNES